MAEIEESMENVDNLFSSQHFSDSDPPSPEQLLAMLEKLSGLSNVDRKELLQELFKQKLLTEREPVEPVQQLLTSQFLVLLALLFIIATIFVFFGYKLYKSLKEKERKRDEKKKLRQQKKKK